MISANDVRRLTEFYSKKVYGNYNLSRITEAAEKGKTSCYIILGTSLTDEELNNCIKEYENSGYRITKQGVCTAVGGVRDPEQKIPPEYWAIISWK